MGVRGPKKGAGRFYGGDHFGLASMWSAVECVRRFHGLQLTQAYRRIYDNGPVRVSFRAGAEKRFVYSVTGRPPRRSNNAQLVAELQRRGAEQLHRRGLQAKVPWGSIKAKHSQAERLRRSDKGFVERCDFFLGQRLFLFRALQTEVSRDAAYDALFAASDADLAAAITAYPRPPFKRSAEN